MFSMSPILAVTTGVYGTGVQESNSWFQSNIQEKFRGYGGIMKPNIDPKFKGSSSGGLIDDSKTFFQNANEIINNFKQGIDWLNHWKEHTLDLTVKTLGWVYDFLSNFILHTPTWLFTSEWFVKISVLFGVISVLLTMLLSCIEGIKAILNKPHTNPKRILRRFPFAVAAAGFSPLVFEKVFAAINKVSSTVVAAGKSQITMDMLAVNITAIKAMDAITLLAFDLVLVGALVPITLTIARRWFDLLALGGLTPVAFTTWLFDDYEQYYSTWWRTIKKLALVQLYYAVFITIIGILIMGVHQTTSATGLLVKLLVIAGGLWRMANPPSIVRKHMDTGANIEYMYRQTADVITMKNLKRSIKGLQAPTVKGKPAVLRTHRKGRVLREKIRRSIIKWLIKK